MDVKTMMESADKSPFYGNQNYGTEFDDMAVCSEHGFPLPSAIVVRKGGIVDQVSFLYKEFEAKHGGEGGTKHRYDLDSDEKIVKVRGCMGKFANERVIAALEFTTDKKRVLAVGSVSGREGVFEFSAKEGHAICALYGRSARYMGGIGFYTCKTDMDFAENLKGAGAGIMNKLK